MEHILEKLFELAPNVAILKLFVRNQEHFFTFKEIKEKSQVNNKSAQRELHKFIKIGLIKKKNAYIKEIIKTSKNTSGVLKAKNKKVAVFCTNKSFIFLRELQDLVNKSLISVKKINTKIRKVGNVKLAILSGVFLNEDNARTDLLIVADSIKNQKLKNLLVGIEYEFGRSIHYTIMDTDEFKYRIDMYDRFLRDILDRPHKKLINRLDI